MGVGVKISTPGNDALSDTDLDHFSLWVDDADTEDNILIKEFARGSASVEASFATPYEITHNLGYIPMFFVFCYYENHLGLVNVPTNKWVLLPFEQISGGIQPFYVYADTTKIYIWNFDDVPTPSSTTFKWYIFYDNQVGSSGISITESDYVFKVSKTGVDALTSTDPNDYIFHSDLNTFKIIKEATADITYTADGLYTVAHGLSSYSPTSMILFVKFPDGYAGMSCGLGQVTSRDSNFNLKNAYVDASNIGFYLYRTGGSATALKIKYYIFETPL